jgi:V8-like Glu-specific endopeptidase
MQPAQLPDALHSPVSKRIEPPVATAAATRGAIVAAASPAQPHALDQSTGSVFPGVPGLDYTMCLLQCEYPGGQWVGSGVMIGKRTVLTVAHNLFNKFDGHNPTPINRVTVLPGAHMGTDLSAVADYGDCWHSPQWAAFASSSDYSNDWRDPSPYDFGVINLPAATSWDQVTPIGWGPVDDAPFPPEWFQQTTAYLFGYPHGSTNPGYPSLGRAAPYTTDYLTYNMLGIAGMSGGPTFCYYQNGPNPWAFLLDVQSMTFSSASPPYSLGVRVTSRVVSAILANAREQMQ